MPAGRLHNVNGMALHLFGYRKKQKCAARRPDPGLPKGR